MIINPSLERLAALSSPVFGYGGAITALYFAAVCWGGHQWAISSDGMEFQRPRGPKGAGPGVWAVLNISERGGSFKYPSINLLGGLPRHFSQWRRHLWPRFLEFGATGKKQRSGPKRGPGKGSV
ncbi:MAG: hypothetical protein CM15mP46_7340 [Alphaproteobacteria bacterium]|nr:MAG: hypothetical protein CM15mP46_7340 [Alphaproteobacteria bacterium]